MSNLYSRIEQLCNTKGINITQMCKEAGVSRASLTDLKMVRKQGLSSSTLSKISNYFGVSVDYLLGTEKDKTAAPKSDDLNEYLEMLRNRPECRMLFSVAKDATKGDVEKAVAIIEALRKTEEKN